MDHSKVTVIIPTLNEAENVGKLLERITQQYPSIKIIIADDGSGDGTVEQVLSFKEKGVLLLDRKAEKTKGLTASVLDALEKVRTRYFIVMDADFQHPPEKIKDVAGLLEKNAVVIPTRKEIFKWEVFRRAMSSVACHLAKIRLWFSGSPIPSDSLSGFFAGETGMFMELKAKHPPGFVREGYKVLFDFLKIMKKGNVKIKEFSYFFDARKEGKSKMDSGKVIAFLKSVFT